MHINKKQSIKNLTTDYKNLILPKEIVLWLLDFYYSSEAFVQQIIKMKT